MALQIANPNNQLGVVFPEAYARVAAFRSSDKEAVEIFVYIHATSGAREAGMDPFRVSQYTFPFDLRSSDNIYVQAYNYLKSLPEFSGAIDV